MLSGFDWCTRKDLTGGCGNCQFPQQVRSNVFLKGEQTLLAAGFL